MGDPADPDWRTIWRCLQRNRCRAEDLRPEDRPGIYALFLKNSEASIGLAVEPAGPLYVGMSESGLDVRNHFAHRHSGFSTVRRSLGAILKQQLGLKAEPRAPGPSPTNVARYRFTEAGEQALTNWMRIHLECAFQVVEHGARDLEQQLIKELKPPLNLSGWSNPCRAWLRDLRKDCRAGASQARSA